MTTMGGDFNPLLVQLPIALLFLMTNPSSITASLSSTTPQSPPPPVSVPNKSPLRPSVAVVIGVITTMFSITFLLLLYAKHCRRRVGNDYSSSGANILRAVDDRKNSGIDRTIIESLPVFRFGSLSGQKDGLECAVCLNQFDPIEVLRLLPKCKHAFHVECVDTWLDAHSTCPLCRYRVDPEDILLVEEKKIQHEVQEEQADMSVRRVSGRHSSAGETERKNGFLQISIEPAGTTVGGGSHHRRSLDSSSNSGGWRSKKKKKKNEETALPVATAGFVDRHRKDGLLLAEATEAERRSMERRFEHRIIVSAGGTTQHRWSDVQPSDLLYLRREMIISDSHRFSGVSGSRPSWATRQQYNNNNNNNNNINSKGNGGVGINVGNNGWWQWQRWRRRQRQNGRSVINTRSVSEITGLSRFRGSNEEEVEEEGGTFVSKWLAWRYLAAAVPPPPPASSSLV